jgi:hypothetical protein
VIRFMAPDLPRPSGGIKVIYSYVEHLNALGMDAVVWHGTPGFSYPDLPSAAPVVAAPEVEALPGDVLVMPETGGSKWSFLSGGEPVVMLCQGMDFVFADSDFLTDVPGDYPGWPQAVSVLAVSEAIATFLEHACTPGFPIHRVPVEIEDYFRPRPKERRIALMPRRRREDLLGAVQLIRRSGRLDGWEIVLIDGMSQAQVAEELGRSAIFLFGAEREGLGLPGAEAMAAGCYVIGFTGDGAKEYLTPDVAGVVLDSDVVGMAEMTLDAMRAFDHDRAALQERIDRGRDRVRERHSQERVRAALAAAFEPLLAEGSAAALRHPVRLSHYQVHAPRTGPHWAAWYAARRQGRRALEAARARRPSDPISGRAR